MSTAPLTASYVITAEHPCLAGHFPGRPVVPGVLLIEYVLTTLRDCRPKLGRLTGVPQVKFLRPVLPDEAFRVVLEPGKAAGSFRFTLSVAGETAAVGRVQVDAA